VAGFSFCVGEIMTLYAYYQQQKNFCELLGRQPNINENLRTFYAKAARGYEIKLENLTLSEAAK
jgi:hypothetical protein